MLTPNNKSNVGLFEFSNIRDVPRSIHGLGANYRFAREYINRNSLIREATLRAASGIRYANVEICPRARCYSFGSRNSGRPLFVSYVPVTRNEASTRCIALTVRQFARPREFRCNTHRKKVFRFVAFASEIGEVVFMSLTEIFLRH